MASLTLVNTLVQNYQTARDAFNEGGGEAFLIERQALRSDYCRAKVTALVFSDWVNTITHPKVQGEFVRRFEEWDKKIAKGALTQPEHPEISQEELVEKVHAFYEKYHSFIEASLFESYTDTKAALRAELLPELKVAPAEEVGAKYGIVDQELLYRMQKEWKELKA